MKLISKIQANVSWIVLYSLLVYLPFLSAYPLFDKDEPYYAESAREMIESNSYLVPFFNYQTRYEKPILFYWLETLSFKAFGLNEFAARLPSVLFAICLVLVFYFFVKRVSQSNTQAFYGALILSSCLEFFLLARMSITDMVLNFFISTGLMSLYLFIDKQERRYLYLSSIAFALGILTKGPVAIILPVLIIAIYLLSTKSLIQFLKSNARELFKALLVLLLIASPWYILVHFATNGEFTKVFFLQENLARFLDKVSVHEASAWWFYIPVFLVGFMPWTLIFGFAFSKDFFKKPLNKFALIWLLTVLIFYSIAQVKLMNYILPVYLPAAIITASFINSQIQSQRASRMQLIALILLSIASLVNLFLAGYILPKEHQKKFKIMLDFISSVPAHHQIYSYGYQSPLAIFHAKRRIQNLKRKEFLQVINSEQASCIIIRKSALERIRKKHAIDLQIRESDRKNFYICL